MAINKAKVAIGFMVAGVLAVILGTVLTFVGPIIIDDQVVKVSRPFSMCTVFLTLSLRGEFVDVLSQTLSTRSVLITQYRRPAPVPAARVQAIERVTSIVYQTTSTVS